MKLGLAIREVAAAEATLAEQLNALGERHKADHDVYHLTGTLQGIARANLERLAPLAERYGSSVDPAREEPSKHLRRGSENGLLLLRDLRELHLLYAEASINWVMLGQGAQAARDNEVLEAVAECHPQTLRGMKWTVTRIKEAAPQALTS
jgi:hypothetical protein